MLCGAKSETVERQVCCVQRGVSRYDVILPSVLT